MLKDPKTISILVCGASNLTIDDIPTRFLALPVSKSGSRLKVTGVGYPARVMSDDKVLSSSLDTKAARCDEFSHSGAFLLEAVLSKDVKVELKPALSILPGKGKGLKGKSPHGLSRKKFGRRPGDCERGA